MASKYDDFYREVESDWIRQYGKKPDVKELVYRLSFYDQQLGIYNIRYINRSVQSLIENGVIGDYTAIYFNLRRFVVINQQIGRTKGTQVMKKFLAYLQSIIGSNGIIGRFGGDNFIMIFPQEFVDEVLLAFAGTDIVYGDNPDEVVMVQATAGVYNIPDGCNSAESIFDIVSTAIYFARRDSKPIVYFDEKMLLHENNVKAIENYFPTAIERKEFLVYYQPKVSLEDGSLIGAEALCRWCHEGKFMSPGEFIPPLERSLNICKLDFYMLEQVCRDICRWREKGKETVRVSVNLSRRHLFDHKLLERIALLVDSYEVPHNLIEIELTETTTDVDFKELRKIVTGLRKLGFCTAVDDFGVGYSSLNLIKELPWEILKIDKALLPEKIDEKASNCIMFKHLVALAQSMGLECIAEGVETIEQVKLLKDAGCMLAQGYFFDRPMPRKDFISRLETGYKYNIEI